MTSTDFLPLLESALQARSEPFERAAVQAFVADLLAAHRGRARPGALGAGVCGGRMATCRSVS